MEIEQAQKILRILDKTNPLELCNLDEKQLETIAEAKQLIKDYDNRVEELENEPIFEMKDESQEELVNINEEMGIDEEEEGETVYQDEEFDSVDLEEMAAKIAEEGITDEIKE